MKFTLSWLKDYLDTDATLDDITSALNDVGLEVEEVENLSETLGAFTVAKVKEARQHPDADRLRVCDVETANGMVQVVCGAPNARTGMTGIFAPPGTHIPGTGVDLAVGVIRGVESAGMLCSEREMMLSDEHDGIIDLEGDWAIGTSAVDALGLNDPVIDIAITPNRPDALGIYGIARDLAARGLGTLKPLEVTPVPGTFTSPIDVKLTFDDATKDACPLFCGRYIRGVKNGPSPEWLQSRLLAVGITPKSLLVDVTNYISLDRARPLHAYDAAKLSGAGRARLGRKGEECAALDGKTYSVTPDMCVIADESGVIGLGGVMGGESTAVSDETTDVFIESAWFDPLRTARTGRTTGIISDARYRFERGIDPQSIPAGLAQAVALVSEMCGGEVSHLEFAGEAPNGKTTVSFPPSEVERLTGLVVPEDEMEEILDALGFEVTRGDVWQVIAPSARPDIEGKADIVEEIARIKGLDSLPELTLPPLNAVERPKASKAQERVRLAKRALAGAGYLEAVTWSFCDAPYAALFAKDGVNETLALANPISSDLGMMRPSVLPGLVAAIGRNAARGRKDMAVFEVGPTYETDQPDGQRMVAAGVCAHNPSRHWQGTPEATGVFGAKADAMHVLDVAGVQTQNLMIMEGAPSHYHPGRSGILSMGPKNHLAYFGELHPRVLKAMDVEGPLYAFEVILDKIPAGKTKPTKSKPALNASDLMPLSRDFAFIVDADLPAEKLLKAVRGAEKKLITDVSLFDVYSGKGIDEEKKSLAIEVTLQPTDKTLTDEEIEAVSQRIIKQVQKATGGELRA